MNLRLVSVLLVGGQAVLFLATLAMTARVWIAHVRALRRADQFESEPRLVGRSPLRPREK